MTPPAAPAFRSAILLVNPRAGNHHGLAAAEEAARALTHAGCEVRIEPTTRRGDASRLAARFAGQADVLFAVGGDGTVNEVAAGLEGAYAQRVGVIPVGTANVLARELGIPRTSPEAAARTALNGRAVALDFGRTDRGLMLVNAGAGFDARVVRRIAVLRRKKGGRLATLSYVLPGIRELAALPRSAIDVFVDGVQTAAAASSVIVCNTRNYGGVMSVTPSADPSDRLFDICIRTRAGRFRVVADAAAALLYRGAPAGTLHRRGTVIELRSASPIPIQIDGDLRGRTPFRVALAALPLLVMAPLRETRS